MKELIPPSYVACAGIIKQSMGVRNRVVMWLSYLPARLHKNTGCRWAGTTTLFLLGSIDCLKIPAQVAVWVADKDRWGQFLLPVSTQCCGSVTFWSGSGSAPLTNGFGSGSGSCYFRQCPSRRQLKMLFLLKLFCVFLLFTFWRYIYIIFQR